MVKTVKQLLLCSLLVLGAAQVQAFPSNAAQSAAPPAGVTLASPAGKVVETMNSGGYTHLDLGGQKSWAAIPTTEIKVGEKLAVNPGMVMRNFTSKSLGRTFEAIVFSQGVTRQ